MWDNHYEQTWKLVATLKGEPMHRDVTLTVGPFVFAGF